MDSSTSKTKSENIFITLLLAKTSLLQTVSRKSTSLFIRIRQSCVPNTSDV